MNLVDLDEPTSFLDHAYLGCTPRECKPNEIIIEQHKEMFESCISAGATEKLPGWRKPHAKTVAWSYDMEGHAQKCVERHCELSNKKDRATTHSLNQFKRKTLNQLENYQKVWSQIVLKCLYMGRIGRPDILWSVNKLARAVTKLTRACDRRLARMVAYIHHTNDHRQYCHMGNTAQHCRWGLFQDSDSAGYLEDSKSTSGGNLVYIWKSTILSPLVGCARSQRQYPTVLQNPKSFRWMLDCEWMVYLIEVLRPTKSNHQPIPKHLETDARQVTVCETPKLKHKGNRDVVSCHMWIMSPRTLNSL